MPGNYSDLPPSDEPYVWAWEEGGAPQDCDPEGDVVQFPRPGSAEYGRRMLGGLRQEFTATAVKVSEDLGVDIKQAERLVLKDHDFSCLDERVW